MHNQLALCEKPGITIRADAAGPTPSASRAVVSLTKWTTESRNIGRELAGEVAEGQLASKLFSVVSELIQTMADALAEDRATAEDCVQQACSVLLSYAHAADQPANTTVAASAASGLFRGGLAPWQVRTLTAHIDANLNTSLQCETLARLAGLSMSHFARTFKYTFGFSPHVFLVRRRMERAQGLMLQSTLPLAQIATDCGFSDQAHFSRLFLQCTGETPGAWRRARVQNISAVKQT